MVLDFCVTVLIQTLIQKTMLLEAIDNIYAYQLVHKFQPVRLLKGYLKFNKKIINRKENKSVLQQVFGLYISHLWLVSIPHSVIQF